MTEQQVTHEEIETAFSIAMACRHVPDDSDHICWNCTIKIIDRAESAESRLCELESANAELTQQLEQALKDLAKIANIAHDELGDWVGVDPMYQPVNVTSINTIYEIATVYKEQS